MYNVMKYNLDGIDIDFEGKNLKREKILVIY